MSVEAAKLNFDEEDMKILLNYPVSLDDIEMHRKNYESQLASNNVDLETKFQYAWCLTHSNNTPDMKKASILFEEVFKEGTEELKRDSLFYLAIVETKLKNYVTAKKYIEAFLSVEPANVQADQLKCYIAKKLKSDGVTGMAILGAAAIFGGAAAILVGTAIAGTALGWAISRRFK